MLNESPVHDLSDEQCWEFLGNHEFGRLAFHLAGEVHIAPVNYVADNGRLIFRTAEGNKLLGVTMNQDVAFEVDQFTDDAATSVVLRGVAETAPVGRDHQAGRRRHHTDRDERPAFRAAAAVAPRAHRLTLPTD